GSRVRAPSTAPPLHFIRYFDNKHTPFGAWFACAFRPLISATGRGFPVLIHAQIAAMKISKILCSFLRLIA
ncbi:hypothetical protein, partial [uncultured Sulfitobacter sp.]|uniref:hypothetical protein n=1 Tax=uncultured Sulfitobacter sp. TaxID=191468 RepID=UPI002596DCB5